MCSSDLFLSPPFPLYEGALRLAALQAVVRLVFCWPGCVRPGTGGGRVLLSPDRQPWRRGTIAVARPLAAAGGCRLLRRFFFLLKTRNVIPAGPRQGKRRTRRASGTWTWPAPQGLGEAREGGKPTNAAATGRFAARGRTACFYSPPPRQDLAVRGEHRHPQVHRCSTQPSEKFLGRRPLKLLTP